MKLILIFQLLAIFTFGQAYEIGENKLSQFFFDEKIESFRTSLEPDFISIKSDQNVLFVQLMTLDVQESNIVVKTTDGLFYTLTIEPKGSPQTLSYFISKELSVNYSKDVSSNPVASNGKFVSPSNVFMKILDKKGFIRTKNVAHNQNVYLYLKGIYVDSDNIYFRYEIHNKTNINYQVEKINFFISEKESSVMTSTDNAPVEPIQVFQEPKKVIGKTSTEFIFSFRKFTIDRDKKFTINIVESNGDRILNLNSYTDQFAEAKSINF